MIGRLGAISETLTIPTDCRENFLMFMDGRFGPVRGGGGISELRSPYSVKRVTPFTHLAMYTIEGAGYAMQGDRRYPLEKGTLWISPAGLDQDYGADGDWHCLWFHLVTDSKWDHLTEAGPRILQAHDIQGMTGAARSYVREVQLGGQFSEELVDMYARALCIYLERDLVPQGTPGEDTMRRLLGRLWNTVVNDLQADWSVHSMASLIHISPATLHRITMAHNGCTPIGMVVRFRMRRAEQLLVSTGYDLEQISGMVGYATPFAFSRAFKRHSGLPPSEYRRAATKAGGATSIT